MAIKPDNIDTLRWDVRTDGHSGFVFMHNFQDHVETHDLTNLRLELKRGNGTSLTFPHDGTFTLRRGASGILPFNLDLSGVILRTATVQPLTALRRGKETHTVFMTVEGMKPELVFSGDQKIATEDGCTVAHREGITIISGEAERPFHFRVDDRHILVIPREFARTLVQADESSLVFSDADGFPAPAGASLELRAIGRTSIQLQIYPAMAVAKLHVSRGTVTPRPAAAAGMSAWQVEFEKMEPLVTVQRVGTRRLTVSVGADAWQASDVWLGVPYLGDRVEAFIGGELVADHFYYGQPWNLSLREFRNRLKDQDLMFVFHPLSPDASYLGDLPTAVQAELAEHAAPLLKINELMVQPEYRTQVSFEPSDENKAEPDKIAQPHTSE